LKEIIIPEGLNPVDFYGINDINIDFLRKKFPALKIVSRGNILKVYGEDDLVRRFEESVNLLFENLEAKGTLNLEMIREHFSESVSDTASDPRITADVLVFGPQGIMVKARTPGQRRLVEACMKNDVTFAIGPAGTGKTYTAVALAVRALKNREIRRIILTRPAVEAGENLGFLPGDLKEKIDPYLRPLYDALFDMIPAERLQTFLTNGTIEVAPLAFMRGRTLDNAYVILDEAQNATQSQLKMFLTRMGPSAKMILTGDITQIDLPKNSPSGLIQGIALLNGIEGIGFVTLDARDVVRHKLVKDIIEAYGKGEHK
jgi:phosphate starvation-inducible protein PhoH and related proteins